MTCSCGHEADVHDGRCYAPRCQCEGFHEAVPRQEPGASLGDLFPAPKATRAKDEPALPMAVIYPSRSGRAWAHVVTVVDDPARPFLACGCRGFAMRGTCWAVARVETLTGVAARKET